MPRRSMSSTSGRTPSKRDSLHRKVVTKRISSVTEGRDQKSLLLHLPNDTMHDTQDILRDVTNVDSIEKNKIKMTLLANLKSLPSPRQLFDKMEPTEEKKWPQANEKSVNISSQRRRIAKMFQDPAPTTSSTLDSTQPSLNFSDPTLLASSSKGRKLTRNVKKFNKNKSTPDTHSEDSESESQTQEADEPVEDISVPSINFQDHETMIRTVRKPRQRAVTTTSSQETSPSAKTVQDSSPIPSKWDSTPPSLNFSDPTLLPSSSKGRKLTRNVKKFNQSTSAAHAEDSQSESQTQEADEPVEDISVPSINFQDNETVIRTVRKRKTRAVATGSTNKSLDESNDKPILSGQVTSTPSNGIQKSALNASKLDSTVPISDLPEPTPGSSSSRSRKSSRNVKSLDEISVDDMPLSQPHDADEPMADLSIPSVNFQGNETVIRTVRKPQTRPQVTSTPAARFAPVPSYESFAEAGPSSVSPHVTGASHVTMNYKRKVINLKDGDEAVALAKFKEEAANTTVLHQLFTKPEEPQDFSFDTFKKPKAPVAKRSKPQTKPNQLFTMKETRAEISRFLHTTGRLTPNEGMPALMAASERFCSKMLKHLSKVVAERDGDEVTLPDLHKMMVDFGMTDGSESGLYSAFRELATPEDLRLLIPNKYHPHPIIPLDAWTASPKKTRKRRQN